MFLLECGVLTHLSFPETEVASRFDRCLEVGGVIETNKACLAAFFMHSFQETLFCAPLSCLAILQEHSLSQLYVT